MATAQYLYRKTTKETESTTWAKNTRSSKKLHPVIGKDLFHDKKDSVKSWEGLRFTTRKTP
ncbi:hypothetical protein IX307_002827 [Bacteroides pyogenes]|nr:hypothetical protein [Bacteroides pyogenes]MBR8726487.1 hypothetical protein [Bacteroides pyogenes]MBR8739859.1 hypothetical protein [Bacteroides pyogenes]MBR8748207.1 hypothetical protein [Bacteroides pyogenes]MBR8755644.1 hypothetical protein [Bacteroides pyogenes]